MVTDRGALHGVRIIDTTEERGELASRILADLGADVIKVEPVGGASSRHLPPFAPDGTSLSFAVRNTNKRSTIIDCGSETGRSDFERLLAGADIWMVSARPGALAEIGLDPADVAERFPHLVVTSITDFGLTGPYRDFAGTDDVMIAMGGMLARSGNLGMPPLLPPGSLAYDTASTSAAFATLAALWQRRSTGRGQLLDVSVMQAVAQITDWSLANYSFAAETGSFYYQLRYGSGPVYPMYPCADGYVRLIVLSTRQWHAMREWLGDPEVVRDEYWNSLMARMEIQGDVLDPLYIDLFKNFTAAELADEAQRRGIVMTPVLKPSQVAAMPHFIDRGTFVDASAAVGASGKVASGFFEIDGERVGYVSRSPEPGEHSGAIAADVSPVRTAAPDAVGAAMPFVGLKVLDLGHGGVGVEAGRLFAEYGADVIKVETATYPDFIRTIAGSLMSPSFLSSSRCKRSFGVNVKLPSGLATLKRLVEWADVLIENTSTGTMADMGTDYATLKAINPRLVMVSSQLMGSRGAWKDWIGYGPSTRPASGMSHLWNFPDGGMPPGSGAIHPDHLVGRMAAVGALASLIGREEHAGVGAHIELAQVETIVNLLGDLFLKESLEPGSVEPDGNRDQRGAPWGVYQCAGEERWCAITVRNDDDWQHLRMALGDPAWAQSPELATSAGRRAVADELDVHLSKWTMERSDRDVMATLQGVGVPAGMMMYPADLASDEHSLARRFPRRVDQPGLGPVLLEGQAFEATGMPDPLVTPAPMLGEHTREICQQILGMSDDEIDALIAEGALEVAPG
jgi:crotonobetainyl-CoA:carnitine CoA-transferase CaiB-like acyl-CoA transferase